MCIYYVQPGALTSIMLRCAHKAGVMFDIAENEEPFILSVGFTDLAPLIMQ